MFKIKYLLDNFMEVEEIEEEKVNMLNLYVFFVF